MRRVAGFHRWPPPWKSRWILVDVRWPVVHWWQGQLELRYRTRQMQWFQTCRFLLLQSPRSDSTKHSPGYHWIDQSWVFPLERWERWRKEGGRRGRRKDEKKKGGIRERRDQVREGGREGGRKGGEEGKRKLMLKKLCLVCLHSTLYRWGMLVIPHDRYLPSHRQPYYTMQPPKAATTADSEVLIWLCGALLKKYIFLCTSFPY